MDDCFGTTTYLVAISVQAENAAKIPIQNFLLDKVYKTPTLILVHIRKSFSSNNKKCRSFA